MNDKINTLKDITEDNDNNEFTPIDINDIIPPKQGDQSSSIEEKLFADLDTAIEVTKQHVSKNIETIREEKETRDYMESADAYTDNTDGDDNVVDYVSPSIGSDISGSIDRIDDRSGDDVYEEDDTDDVINTSPTPIVDTVEEVEIDDNNEISDEEIIKELKSQLKSKSTKRRVDLSKFSISTKPISAAKAMKIITLPDRNVADWVLYSAKRSISMSGLSGAEIMRLNPDNSGKNRINTLRDKYRILYDHILDTNKPSFEAWLKSTRFSDVDHIHFCLYRATFNGSNFLNMQCPKCQKIFISDMNFEDMVEYASDYVKTEVMTIFAKDTTSKNIDGEYTSTLVQISDDLAFAIKSPSIWNTVFEPASLSDKMITDFRDLIDLIVYIDAIYVINHTTGTLDLVDTKPDENDIGKTVSRKFKLYFDIINNLSSEEYYDLRSNIIEIDDKDAKISYMIPGCKCPACNADVPANKEVNAEALLFTRHQLAAIATSSHT